MEKCNAITKKGVPCSYKAKENGRCGIHNKSPKVKKMIDTIEKKIKGEKVVEKKVKKEKKVVEKKEESTITITFGDCAENHVGMQKLGEIGKEGFSLEDLDTFAKFFESKATQENKISTEVINLGIEADDEIEQDPAHILVIRNGVSVFCNPEELNKALLELEWDKKALMRGKVVNKHARHNLCFSFEDQEPDYEEGKGRIISFEHIPDLLKVKEGLGDILPDKSDNLVAEGNLYYDVSKCGIGFHGDTERRKVIALRFGASIPLHYQWFVNSKPIGERFEIEINHGDLYIMSEKAVGFDWKKKKIPTLRHAAGCIKYLTIKGSDKNE